MYIRFADLLTEGFLSYCERGYFSYANIITLFGFDLSTKSNLHFTDNFANYSQIINFSDSYSIIKNNRVRPINHKQ